MLNKYDAISTEEKWMKYWEKNKTNKIDEKKDGSVYSIDTPPPTVSGNIHIGHIFSYSQAEMIARYKKLKGFNVFYPFGFDDNGLPTERLVEREKGLTASEIGREEFNKMCLETTNKYEEDFRHLWSRIGISCDWDLEYKTISDSSIKISQLSFLDLAKKKNAYYKESPALWCNECSTSIAQAELETKTLATTFNHINFKTTDGDVFAIATTRPELLGACVAVFVNPDDQKNGYLIGKTAIVPLFNFEVPILADEKVAVDKGTGVVMCCTFGDQTDIEWWKKHNLPLKNIFTQAGRIVDGTLHYGGLRIKQARKQIIEDLNDEGLIIKIEDLEHEVQVHERCGKEIEYTVINQWFIDILSHKDKFLEMGSKINWYPKHMKSRYDEWVKNLMWDWCISRQRYFGVPFPVWYCKDCGIVKYAKEEDLPVNPLKTMPNDPCECGSSEFTPESDVMDTWATSSITPLINMKYKEDTNYEDILRPMSLRCNAHDIIRTWDFYTIVKSFYHFKEIPWENVMISGFVLADKGAKISKSKSNSKVEPLDVINEYSADVVRYWAASGRLGTDIIFTDETFRRGKKLLNKLWNLASFIDMHLEDYAGTEVSNMEYMDRWIIGKYIEMEKEYTKYLDAYEIGLALNTLEKFFWNFCDNYIEIVKHRLYRPDEFKEGARLSGQKTIHMLLFKLVQNFSIYFPFITEEIYSSVYKNEESIHNTKLEDLEYEFISESNFGDTLIDIISEVRGEKTNNSVSLKTLVKNLDIKVNVETKGNLTCAFDDIKATLNIENVNMSEISDKSYEITKIELEI